MHNISRFIEFTPVVVGSAVPRMERRLPGNAFGDTRPFERSPTLASEAQFANVALPARFIYCDATARQGIHDFHRTLARPQERPGFSDQREPPPGTSVATP